MDSKATASADTNDSAKNPRVHTQNSLLDFVKETRAAGTREWKRNVAITLHLLINKAVPQYHTKHGAHGGLNMHYLLVKSMDGIPFAMEVTSPSQRSADASFAADLVAASQIKGRIDAILGVGADPDAKAAAHEGDVSKAATTKQPEGKSVISAPAATSEKKQRKQPAATTRRSKKKAIISCLLVLLAVAGAGAILMKSRSATKQYRASLVRAKADLMRAKADLTHVEGQLSQLMYVRLNGARETKQLAERVDIMNKKLEQMTKRNLSLEHYNAQLKQEIARLHEELKVVPTLRKGIHNVNNRITEKDNNIRRQEHIIHDLERQVTELKSQFKSRKNQRQNQRSHEPQRAGPSGACNAGNSGNRHRQQKRSNNNNSSNDKYNKYRRQHTRRPGCHWHRKGRDSLRWLLNQL